MNSKILLDRNGIDTFVCECPVPRGTKGDICQDCDGAIPNRAELQNIKDVLSRINRPERKICPACGAGDKYCRICGGTGKVNK